MFTELQQSLDVYLKRPVFFINNSLIYLFFQLLITLALIGVVLLAFFVASAIKESPASALKQKICMPEIIR